MMEKNSYGNWGLHYSGQLPEKSSYSPSPQQRPSQDDMAGEFDLWKPSHTERSPNITAANVWSPTQGNSSNTSSGYIRQPFYNSQMPVSSAVPPVHSTNQQSRMLSGDWRSQVSQPSYNYNSPSDFSPVVSSDISLQSRHENGTGSRPVWSDGNNSQLSQSVFHSADNGSSWNNGGSADVYQNPLDASSDKFDNSAEALIKNLHDLTNKENVLLEQNKRKPQTFSRAALATIIKDLDDAASPFQSVETFKHFRDLKLGLSGDDGSIVSVIPSASKLSADAPLFIPRSRLQEEMKSSKDVDEITVESDSEEETIAIELTDDCINQLTCNPACLDEVVPSFIAQLRKLKLSASIISVIAEKIYEMCILESNFRFTGSQLCDKMSRSDTGLPTFRSTLLTKAQKEFNSMDIISKSERVRGFTQFVAELFLNLKYENEGALKRFLVLGRGTLGVVRKLVDNPDNNNLQCAIRVLKLTVIAMEDALKNDQKQSMEKLEAVLDDLEAISNGRKRINVELNDLTRSLLRSVSKLRKQNWGRLSSSERATTSKTSHLRPESDENYYMNEPVFFTPRGVQYTAADAADPDFYNQYLAQYSSQTQPSESSRDVSYKQNTYPQPQYYGTDVFTQNPLDAAPSHASAAYPAWSAGDSEAWYSPGTLDVSEDDYDVELEKFLGSIGQ